MQAARSAWQRSGGSAFLARWRVALELLAFGTVLALCVAVRVVSLGKTPRVITADEVDNLHDAYRIIAGTGPGAFGLDWHPGPALELYPLAWSIRLFGDSVADFRMYSVVLSLLTIVLFYVLVRQSTGVFSALAAAVLLGTNLWFLHFSRTAWENMTAGFAAVGACWAITRALKDRDEWMAWWPLAGVFLACGLYGYFSGRLLSSAVILAVAIGVITRQAPVKQAIGGLALALFVGVGLFAPMYPQVVLHWEKLNKRAETVSVFHDHGVFDGRAWGDVRKSGVRNFKAFALFDGSVMHYGYWGRYNPKDRAGLDAPAALLFWLGAVVGVVRWRKTYTWWPFFLPLALAEVFSKGTPDLARGVFVAPFYFLFIALLFDEAIRAAARPVFKAALGLGIVALVAFIAVSNVRDYFAWQGEAAAQGARLPGVDRCEFPIYQQIEKKAAKTGDLVDKSAWDAQQQEISCSPITHKTSEDAP